LYLNAEALREVDRIEQMPAIQAESLLAHVEPIGSDHLRHAQVRGRELRVAATRNVEVPRAPEVILCSGSADCGELLVGVEVELDLTLPPPPVGVDAPGDVRADVLAGALDGTVNV
jgi:hypothetical protein